MTDDTAIGPPDEDKLQYTMKDTKRKQPGGDNSSKSAKKKYADRDVHTGRTKIGAKKNGEKNSRESLANGQGKVVNSPSTPNTREGRTRNIKSPNWADIIRGKVAFKDDPTPVKNLSPPKEKKVAVLLKKPQGKRGRPRFLKAGENREMNPEKSKVNSGQTGTEDDEIEGESMLKKETSKETGVSDENKMNKENYDKSEEFEKVRNERDKMIEGTGLLEKEENQIKDNDTKRQRGRPKKLTQGSTDIVHEVNAEIEDDCSGPEKPRQGRARPHKITSDSNSEKGMLESEGKKEISNGEPVAKRQRGRPKRYLDDYETEDTRSRPAKVKVDSEEIKIDENGEESKKGRVRSKKETEDTYETKELKSEEEKDQYDVIEWTGSGNLYKVRAKGNRHMPFQLKEVDEDQARDEKADGMRSSSRVKRNKFECEICKRGFSIEYVFEEHKKSHSEADYKDKVSDAIDYIDDSDNDTDFKVEDAREEEDKDSDQVKQLKMLNLVKVQSQKSKSSPEDENKKPVCEICGTTFLSSANLRKHNLLHSDRMYECPYCAKLMKRKDYVNAHIRKVHKHVDLEKNPVDFSKYTHVIPGGAKDKTNENVENDKEIGETEDKSERKVGKPKTGLGKSVCPECNKVYDEQADLEQHMLLVHDKELKDASYTCQACSKQFKSLVSYQVHKLTHRKKVHDCQHCGQVFKTNSQLQVHRRHDHNVQYGTLMYFGFLMSEGKIACEICSAKFENMSEYHDHRPEHVVFEYLCRECGNGFDSAEDFAVHQESKCSNQNLHLMCGVCDQRFSTYDTRRKHVLANHPKGEDNYCHHCGANFTNITDLTEHFATHVKEKIFVCDYCEKKFFEKRNLVDHRVLHRSTKNFKCQICDNYYISSKSLQRHIKLHLAQNKFSCAQCDSKFSKKDDLDRHIRLNHNFGETEKVENVCNICGRQFLKKTSLMKHMQVHIKGESDEKYTCVYCKSEYNPKDLPLWKHMKESHPEELKQKSQKKELTCETCGFTTVHRQRLTRHMETHNPDRRFSCMYCDRMFQTTSSLLTHMMVHRGRVKSSKRPPSDCSWPGCNKKFFKRSGMKAHLLTHIFKLKNGKDVCGCENCGKNDVDTDFAYFTDKENNSGMLMDGSTLLLKTNNIMTGSNENQNSETINVVISSDGIIQSYESMNVLQEAIAKIEDLEKEVGKVDSGNNGNEFEMLADITDIVDTTEKNIPDITEQETNLNENVVERSDAEITAKNATNDVGVQADQNKESEALASNGIIAEDCIGSDISKDLDYTRQEASHITQDIVLEKLENEDKTVQYSVKDSNVEQEEKENNSAVLLQNKDQSPNTHGTVSEGQSEQLDEDFEPIEINIVHNNKKNQEEQRNDKSAVENNAETEGYECSHCELMFPTKCMVLSHLEEGHIDHQFPSCDVCGKIFIDSKSVKDHMVIHSTERKFACETCGKSFRTKQCLKQHSFIHAEVKPFICSYCGHGFTQKGFFEEHVRRHTGNRPFKCKICFKGFYSKNLRKLHMYSHTGNNPYKCEHCPKSFKERYVLEAHMRTHREERPFRCTYCEKAFFVKPKLVRHLNTVHGIKKEYLTDYFATRIGTGFGYRSRKNTLKPKPESEEPRKTQVIYIDHQGNIVSQEMKTEAEIQEERDKVKKEHVVKRVSPKPMVESKQPQIMKENVVANSGINAGDTIEVLTRKDPSGQILVNPIIPGEMTSVLSDSVSTDMAQHEVYQDIQTITSENGIVLDGENYTFVTEGEDQGHIQLITQALAGVQGQAKQDPGQIQIVSEQINSDGVEAYTESDIAVYSGENIGDIGEVSENFSINIAEDGTVDAADFEKIEALRTLYNDQPIVIVLESQTTE